ncbi:MAG: CBS-domain-containing membrane protein [Candidatus Azotimanducaceae bacterium]|jgi:CBS-domain-containing membrane protein
MGNIRSKIAVSLLSDKCGLLKPVLNIDKYDLNSPAVSLMVDFKKTNAITASSNMVVNDALELMRSKGIRALMVINSKGDFAGLISSMDLMGRKPMAYANEAGIPRSEVQVKDIMLSKARLRAVKRSDVEKSTLDDILQIFLELKEQHLLVVEGLGNDQQISGMFSTSDLKRALNVNIDTLLVANTLMDIERVINENRELM